MKKHKDILFLLALLLFLVLVSLYPQIRAFGHSYTNIVAKPHYHYQVEILPDGSLAALIFPEPSKDNSSAFSEAYLAQSRAQLDTLMQKDRNADVDVLALFVRPLNRDQANKLLDSVHARVFESAVVGYQWGAPFAGYNIEQGPQLARSLDEIAADFPRTPEAKLQASGVFSKAFSNPEQPVDVRGYLAVRAIIPAYRLRALVSHPLIRFVDATPQIVYEEIHSDPRWRDKAPDHRHVRIEMPVWAYPW